MTLSVTVTADKLHMRQGAGRTFDSHLLVDKGELLAVLAIDATGTWLQVNQGGTAGKQGWCSARFLSPKTTPLVPWLDVAIKEIGVKEYPDANNNHPRIQAYLATVNGLDAIQKSTDETAWCSCFMNWCVEQVQINGTDSARAKSWGNWRKEVAIENAQVGDLAVFDRRSATASGGHVGIVIEVNDARDEILVLGGNQSSSVSYSWYPVDGVKRGTYYRLLSCRRYV